MWEVCSVFKAFSNLYPILFHWYWKTQPETQTAASENTSTNQENVAENITTSKSFKKPSLRNRKPYPVELPMIEALKVKPDRHRTFFAGILPSLNTFNENEILEFQIQ